MPFRINGIGTGYYGRKNLREQNGRCTGCGYEGPLKNYETLQFFAIFFIPLIPMGRRHLFDYCPKCSRHFAFTPEKLSKSLGDAKVKLDAVLREKPDDKEAVHEAVGPLFEFHDHEGLLHVAQLLDGRSPEDPELARLPGEIYRLLKRWDDALRVYQRLQDRFPDREEFREKEGLVLAGMGKLDEARVRLAHVHERAQADKVWMLDALASEYRLRGEHGRALEIYDQMQSVIPDIVNDKSFVKDRAASEKNLHARKPVGKGYLPFHTVNGPGGWNVGARLATATAPLLVLCALTAYLFFAVNMGSSRKVWFVNGLSDVYTISINGGDPVVLAPGRPASLNVAEGAISITPLDGAPIEPLTVTLRTSLLSRPFTGDHTYIINPDLCALVERWQVVYTPENRTPRTIEPDHEIHTGLPLYSFGRVEYPFSMPPATVKLSSNARESIRMATNVMNPTISWYSRELGTPIVVLAGGQAHGDVLTMLRARLKSDPGFADALTVAASLMDESEVAELARSSFEQRPVLTEFHRAYQDVLRRKDHDAVLRRYRELVAAEPDDSDLVYLLSRVVKGDAERWQLLQRAVSLPSPSPFAWHSMAFTLLANGDFAGAAVAAERIRESGINRPEVTQVRRQVLAASGNWDELCRDLHQEIRSGAEYFQVYVDYLAAVAQSRGRDEAIQELPRLDHQMTQLFGAAGKNKLIDYLREIIDEVSRPGSIAPLRFDTDSQSYVTSVLFRDGLDAALKAAEETGTTYLDDVFLYVALRRSGRHAESTEFFNWFMGFIEENYVEGSTIHSVMTRQPGSDPKALLTAPTSVANKLMILLFAGEMFPEHRAAFSELIEKLNFDRRFPYPVFVLYTQG